MPPWPIWSYSESLPFVTRNRTDISSENATVPKTTNVKPFSAIPSTNSYVHVLIVADSRMLRYPPVRTG